MKMNTMEAISESKTEIRVHGKTFIVPTVRVGKTEIIVNGRWLRLAAIKDEDLVDPNVMSDPDLFVRAIKQSKLKADIFTFAQKVPEVSPRFDYFFEHDNAAAMPITTLKEWLEKRVEYDVRKAIKKAGKLGVTARTVPFDDTLVKGIVTIYNESSTRQGKAFWHFGKDFDTVKHEAGTYLEKSEFIGAYYQDELIGFIKMAYIGQIASTIHVIAMKQHFDKKVTNVLLAKAVEVCEQKGVTHLTYGNYIYSDPASSLTEFKRRNGFEMALLPRYYVPLNAKGRLALQLRIHRGLSGIVPERVKSVLRKARARANKSFSKPASVQQKPANA
jgi:hypothetical protein